MGLVTQKDRAASQVVLYRRDIFEACFAEAQVARVGLDWLVKVDGWTDGRTSMSGLYVLPPSPRCLLKSMKGPASEYHREYKLSRRLRLIVLCCPFLCNRILVELQI